MTDLSKRTFKGITAFQYAVWALDWHMWTMMRKYLPDDKAREQCEAMETGSWVSQHGIHANWDQLTNALDTYFQLCKQSKRTEANQAWTKQVGGAQLLLPAHVVNEYCHPTRSFDPCPDFTEATALPRSRKTDKGEWFTCIYNGGSLGSNFAIIRTASGSRDIREGGPSCHGGGFWDSPLRKLAAVDRQSVEALYSARAQQREELFTELKLGKRRIMKIAS